MQIIDIIFGFANAIVFYLSIFQKYNLCFSNHFYRGRWITGFLTYLCNTALPNIALGYCVKFPRCILIYDAGGLFISYSDNTTICKFRRNIRFPILLFVWSLRRTLQMLRTHILTGFHATQIQMLCQYMRRRPC